MRLFFAGMSHYVVALALIGGGSVMVSGCSSSPEASVLSPDSDDVGMADLGTVYHTEVDDAGEPGEWRQLDEDLPVERAHVHQLVVFRGKIYSAGGRTNERSGAAYLSTDSFYYGEFN